MRQKQVFDELLDDVRSHPPDTLTPLVSERPAVSIWSLRLITAQWSVTPCVLINKPERINSHLIYLC